MKNYIILRLKERTTWLGLIAIATAFGCQISPDQAEVIVKTALLLAGLLHAATPD